MIKIENLSYSYGEKTILKNINLTIPDGKKIGIVGESGCGKTTLIKLISGLYKLQSGTILAEGKTAVVMQGERTFPFYNQRKYNLWSSCSGRKNMGSS